MIALVPVKEESFAKWEDLCDMVLSRDQRVYVVNSRNMEIKDDGILCASGFEGPIAESAFSGLLRTWSIPNEFARKVCPEELLKIMITQLGHRLNIDVRILTIDGVAHAIMPFNRLPIMHTDVIEYLGNSISQCDAVLAGNVLRITSVNSDFKDLLPGDAFGFGWELVCSQSGWNLTEASQFAIRMICSNGMLGFDRFASVKRNYNSSEPALETLEKLAQLLDSANTPDMFEEAVDWAAKTRIEKNYEPTLNYLSRRLEGDATKSALSQLTDSHSWYDLVNGVTALAKTHQLVMRRRYEIEGGLLMSWFARQGRTKAPWQTVSCEKCSVWDAEAPQG